jgi:hypothetical protein
MGKLSGGPRISKPGSCAPLKEGCCASGSINLLLVLTQQMKHEVIQLVKLTWASTCQVDVASHAAGRRGMKLTIVVWYDVC